MRCQPAFVDLHVDLPFAVHYAGRPARLAEVQGDISEASLKAGCVRAMVLSLFLPSGLRPRPKRLGELLEVLATAERTVAANSLLRSGAVQVVYGLEGAQALVGQDPRWIKALMARGVALFGLVHANHNDLADSSTDPHPTRGGLTQAGERFVRAVYAAGGLVDVSHASEETLSDVAVLARAFGRPIVASHSNARALADHRRNLSDEQLRQIAASGGLVGVCFHSPFVRRDGRRATVDDVARHVRHLVEVMGSRHVAIGSDFDGLIDHVEGLETHAGLPKLVAALKRQGVTAATLSAVMSGNARRVLGLR